MRILFCSQTHLKKELGGSKVLIELAEELQKIGWDCTLLSPWDIAPDLEDMRQYPERLRRYLIEHAEDYDVIDYDHNHLPFPRSDFPEQTLLVARSVLLWRHFGKIRLPQPTDLKSTLHRLLKARQRMRTQSLGDQFAARTVMAADLINVANFDDRASLVEFGIPEDKIMVIPNGISESHRKRLETVSSASPSSPCIAFVGTFDNRKGCVEFPEIVKAVCESVPGATFRLLGTGWDEAKVLRAFPKRLRNSIEVVPRYRSDELADLLKPCSVGVFPSYIEGFGLGVLEMLAASIPVIAYDSPGPPMMLPGEWLVQQGNWKAMCVKVIELLSRKDLLEDARLLARERSKEFCWRSIARVTGQAYERSYYSRINQTNKLIGSLAHCS